MTLEFEKLTQEVEQMGQATSRRQAQREKQINKHLATLQRHATEWERIDECVRKVQGMADEKWFRAALPFQPSAPLNEGIPAPVPPAQATLIATDGSQILPDRHAPFLYYVINVGGIVYYHGDGRPPATFTQPELTYPGDDLDESMAEFTSASVSIKRDLAEISTLAKTVWQNQAETAPLVALVDQRLLYWPIGSADQSESHRVIDTWIEEMDNIRACGAALAGYIDRPNKISVLNMIRTFDVDNPEAEFDIGRLTRRHGTLNDADLFRSILRPGERSPVFVDVSTHNDRFAAANQEICFFYLNPSHHDRQVARVDIPAWVAAQPGVVEQLHGLLYHQCQILMGNYPYVLTRADEMAVVGKKDQVYLDSWIGLTMQQHGIHGRQTAKQDTKDIARAGKTRHDM